MANAKKCDRCGRYYDENVRFKADKSCDCERLSKVVEMTVGGYRYKGYDLCDNCIEDFKKFISGRKLAEEDS